MSEIQALVAVINAFIDARNMKKALDELDPFVWARPCWQGRRYA